MYSWKLASINTVGENISKSYSIIVIMVSLPFLSDFIESTLGFIKFSRRSIFSVSGNLETSLQMVGRTLALISSESFR